MEAESGPLRRTMPIPPRPGAVEMAAMVSRVAAVISGVRWSSLTFFWVTLGQL